MADILLDEQSAPVTPASGQGVHYIDNAVSQAAFRNDGGRGTVLGGGQRNWSTAAQTLGVTDTYVTGSNIVVPSFGFQAGMRFRVRISLSKNGAGVAIPSFVVRIGTAGAIGDTARVSFSTGVAQTAIAEVMWLEYNCIFRAVGAAGQLQTSLVCTRTGGTAATGFSIPPVIENTSGTFDTAWVSGQQIGVSINPGASSSWVVTQVQADLD